MYSLIIIGAVIFFDQIIKIRVVEKIMPYESIEVLKNFLYITYVENTGISFGLFKGFRWVFIILTFIVCLILFYYVFKLYKRHIAMTVCLAFIIGGAIGNLIDRIRLGYVIDYIHFIFFPPVFNLADSAIVCGAIVLCGLLLFNKNISL
ncbi:signal peptidase II [Lutispora thermophila DSM 19022]|uniref:Lipoprotein signal peptidase n=1 Tax=Lutispora thermophila DSM 19022 TaxID=1122184 RepID=A0A1M6G2F4_9FIRM|nr:signal peptidase II [Lutispora thermophila DSM 19022]